MIYVFKTSLNTAQDVEMIQSALNKILLQAKWNVDLEDCDNILRIDSSDDIVFPVIGTLKKLGYECEELV